MKAALIACAVLVSSCAAQSYARLDPMSGEDAVKLSCSRIEVEIARAEGFRHEVSAGAGGWLSGPARLTTVGAANASERSAAARSADRRLDQLHAAQAALGCPVEAAPSA